MLFRPSPSPDLDSPAPVVNYYEQLVFDYIDQHFLDTYSEEILQDIACLALNHLPPRYIRHQVDLTFYMTAEEHQEMEQRVENAIKLALKRIGS